MTDRGNNERFATLDFEGFRKLATEEGLSRYERIGFPDSYRAGYEQAIFADLLRRLPPLSAHGRVILDIGPGCSELPDMIAEACAKQEHQLVLVDSPEMLSHIPDRTFIRKVEGLFPACAEALKDLRGRVDALICYSVIHYIFVDANVFSFLDEALALLAPGGWLLIGDIPNQSMRKRFFASDTGAAYHQTYVGRVERPLVHFNQLEPGAIDDAVVLGLVNRARQAGFNAYVVPQQSDLPMANRREDILIQRP